MLITNIKPATVSDQYFNQLADELLNHSYLQSKNSKYRLIEIEFYLKNTIHNDEYTHCNEDQLLFHTFYFHKFKTGTYKAGAFKGMDITLGDTDKKVYFGVLIRSVQNSVTREIIEGPCNTVNCLLADCECASIMDLTNGSNLNIFDNDSGFKLCFSNKLIQHQIYAGPRIGLSEKYPLYLNKPYRYAIRKEKLKKKKTTLVEI